MLHTEDLVGDVERKYDATRALAAFVGAPLDEAALCELVRRPSEFMGSHSGAAGGTRGVKGDKAESTLGKRYGHWQEKVAGKDALRDALLARGADALRDFGYEPPREPPPPSAAAVACAALPEAATAPRVDAQSEVMTTMKALPSRIAVPGGSCNLEPGTDYKGGGADLFASAEADTAACCAKCAETADCAVFTFDIAHGLCYLKRLVKHAAVANPALVSGQVHR